MVSQVGEAIDLDGMLAGQGAEREQPFLGILQRLRVHVQAGGDGFQQRVGFGGFRLGADQGCDGLGQSPFRFLGDLFQPAQRPLQPGERAAFAMQAIGGGVHGLDQLLGVHHQGPLAGQFGFFARLRVQRL